MRMYDDISLIPYKKVSRKKQELRTNIFSLSASKGIKIIPKIKVQPDADEGFPMDKWIMPLQPERYIKCSDNDFL